MVLFSTLAGFAFAKLPFRGRNILLLLIIAVVAVFEIHAEMSAVTAPKARRIRLGLAAMRGCESTAYAKRLSSRWRNTARAMMNAPMKRKISGSANGVRPMSSFGRSSITEAGPHAHTSAERGWMSNRSPGSARPWAALSA